MLTAVRLDRLIQLKGVLIAVGTAYDDPQRSFAPSRHTAFCVVNLNYCSALITKQN